jgi:hypothetical protein
MARDNFNYLIKALGSTVRQGAKQMRGAELEAPETHAILANTQLVHVAAADAFHGLLLAYNEYIGDALDRIQIHLAREVPPAQPHRVKGGAESVSRDEFDLAYRALELRTAQLLQSELGVVRQIVDNFSRWYADIFKGIDREHEREAVGELLSSLPGPGGALGLVKSIRKIVMSRVDVAKPAAGFEKEQRFLQAQLWRAGVAAELLTSFLAALVAMKKSPSRKIPSMAIGDAEKKFMNCAFAWVKKLKR